MDKRDLVTGDRLETSQARLKEELRELVKREVDVLRRELKERDLVTGGRLDAAIDRLKAETHQIVNAAGYKNVRYIALIVAIVVGVAEFIGRFFGAG